MTIKQVCCVSVIAVCAVARATSVRSSGATIVVNEVDVIHLRTSVGGRSPADRASALAAALPEHVDAASLLLKSGGGSFRIVVAGKAWLTVTADEARAAGSTPHSLATAWFTSLKSAVALPAVRLPARNLKAPVGALRSFALVGSGIPAVVVSSSDPKIAKASRSGASLDVQALAPGSARISVAAGSVSTTLDVTVEPMAASFPQSLTASVTGVPASRDTVAGALVAAINNEIRAVEGAQVSFSPPTVTDVGTGEAKVFQVRVKVSGPQSYPAEGMVNVTVRNSAMAYKGETELWYSNNPEPVKKPMRLFVGALKADQPVRMLYHHINASTSSMVMNVEAINNTNVPAKVLLIPGDAEPDQNPVAAGFEAADRFVRSWSKYSGEIVDIPPFSILPISLRTMRRHDTVSGLCYLRLLSGGPEQLVVRAQATPPSVVEKKWKLAMASPTPWRIGGYKKIGDLALVPQPDAVHIYPNPFKEEEVLYSVGGPYGFVRIGQTPIARQDNHGALDGNFGVMYRINATFENRTSAAAEVEVVYEASAGYGGALFLINGDVRRTPVLQPKEETRLSKFRMEPNTTKSLLIMTVPLSGSAYPCTITIRPAHPTSALKSR